jgi:hypothetical protein
MVFLYKYAYHLCLLGNCKHSAFFQTYCKLPSTLHQILAAVWNIIIRIKIYINKFQIENHN